MNNSTTLEEKKMTDNSPNFFQKKDSRKQQTEKAEIEFQRLTNEFGCSERALGEIWKWYDSSKNKGAQTVQL